MTYRESINWIINISADIGKAEHRDLWHYEQALSEIREMLESAQSERKRGRWTRPSRKNTYERFCSECGGKAWFCGKGDYRFCPNCGAEMGK